MRNAFSFYHRDSFGGKYLFLSTMMFKKCVNGVRKYFVRNKVIFRNEVRIFMFFEIIIFM